MNTDHLKELSKDEILFRMKKYDLWKLEDMVLFAYGYEYKNVKWDFILEENAFPQRQFTYALQATNDPNSKTRLNWVKKDENGSLWVKKGTFFKWMINAYGPEDRLKKVFSLWKQHKNSTGTTSPALQTTEVKIKNCGDKIQIAEFIEHCKTKLPENYNANKTEIAKKVMLEMQDLKCTFSTFRRYVRRMSTEDLKKHVSL